MIVDDGETVREVLVPLLTTSVKPSDQVMFHGAVPVKDAVIVAELPAQIVALPLTFAAGTGFTETSVLPEPMPLQKASLIVVTL